MMQSTSYSFPAATMPVRVTRSMPAGPVDERDRGHVERGEILVVEEGTLAQVPVVRLERVGDGGVVDHVVDSSSMGFHDRVVECFGREREPVG
jgi:hypothetical protein